MTNDFASVKLTRPFVAWLKQEAARRGIPMYALVEDLAERAGHRPWLSSTKPMSPSSVAQVRRKSLRDIRA